MLSFRFENSPEQDEKIIGSRKSKVVQAIAQFGGMALAGTAAEKFKGDPFIISWLTSMALTGVSVRLGLERGSAIRRQQVRTFSDEIGVADLGFTATESEMATPSKLLGVSEPFVATHLAMWIGLEEGWRESHGSYDGPWLPGYATLPLGVAAGAAAIVLSENAGKALDTKPILHNVTHLSPRPTA